MDLEEYNFRLEKLKRQPGGQLGFSLRFTAGPENGFLDEWQIPPLYRLQYWYQILDRVALPY